MQASALSELVDSPIEVEFAGPFSAVLTLRGNRRLVSGREERERLSHYDRALFRLGRASASRAFRLVERKKQRFLVECDRSLANAILRFAAENEVFSISCAPAMPSSLRALVVKKANEQGVRVLEFRNKGGNPPHQAVGTAVSPPEDLKGQAPVLRSAHAHAIATLCSPILEDKIEMTDLLKDLTESTTHFISGSLDHLKSAVDRTAKEIEKTDLTGMTKRVIDSAIDNTKNVIEKVSEPQGSDPFGKAKALVDSTLDATKHVLNTVAEENKKVDLTGAVNRVIQDGFEIAKEQADLTIDTTKKIADSLMGAMPSKPTAKCTTSNTKVEIEIEKPKKI